MDYPSACCPAELVTVPLPYFATSRPDFITNPAGTSKVCVDMALLKNKYCAFPLIRNVIMTIPIYWLSVRKFSYG